MAGALHVVDARSRGIEFFAPPSRIVSLVPSDTFSVAALGRADRLVGRTEYCDRPEALRVSVATVGGTKNPRVDDVLALAPDLVLANLEENTRADVEALERAGLRVYVSFPKSVAEGLAHLARLARILGAAHEDGARALVKRGYDELRAAEAARGARPSLRTFCPIWDSPLMTIHGATFVSDMLEIGGMNNVFADRERRYPLAADMGRAAPMPPASLDVRDIRYPRVTVDEVVARAPEAIVLPDEPYAFGEADAARFRSLPVPAGATGAVVCAAGRDLTWYGAWSAEAIARVRALGDGLRTRARRLD